MHSQWNEANRDGAPQGTWKDRALTALTSLSGAVAAAGAQAVMAADPVAGSMVGSVVGSALTETANGIIEKYLGNRERRRIGTVLWHAAEKIKAIQKDGGGLRADDFWVGTEDLPSTGEEAFEAVLIAAQGEPEERKVPFMGNLFAFIACGEFVPPTMAQWLIRTAEELSWAQYQVLAIVERTEEFHLDGITLGEYATNWDSFSLHREAHDLATWGGRGLIDLGQRETASKIIIPSTSFAHPKLQNGGKLLAAGLGLADIPGTELQSVIDRMRGPLEDFSEQADLGEVGET